MITTHNDMMIHDGHSDFIYISLTVTSVFHIFNSKTIIIILFY